MKISTLMSYAAGYIGATREIAEMEKAGLDVVWIPQSYLDALPWLDRKASFVTDSRY